MSKEIDDAEEFSSSVKDANIKSRFGDNSSVLPSIVEKAMEQPKSPTDTVSNDGYFSQYHRQGNVYTAMGSTVKKLPSGVYELDNDSYGVPLAKAMSKKSTLLLDLPEMQSAEVIRAVERFWESEKDYKEGNEFITGNAPYKAGALIFGPPGSGKTSTLRIVSDKIVARGGTVFYADKNPHYHIEFLTRFSQIEPDRKSIVILEDIDTLVHSYGEAPYLSMLDSAKTIDNVLFIATTNYPERLDPRIYNRPGRFSHVIKIGYPKPSVRRAYLQAILKNHRDVDHIVENTDNFTIDHLTALVTGVYREKKDLQEEIKRLKSLFRIPKSDDMDNKVGF
jgi:Cdc6-like AAA superfamily ATPase